MKRDPADPTPPGVATIEPPTVDELLADGVGGRSSKTHFRDDRARTEAPEVSFGGTSPCVVAEVIDDRHPTLVGRVEVRWSDAAGRDRRAWVPTLQGLSIRARDRVLLMQPEGLDEPVVTGVLDGFARRANPPPQEGARVELRPDEVVHICDPGGRPLLELAPGEHGPVVRLLTADADVEIPGKLRLRAGSLELQAIAGPVRIQASDDVLVEGEIVRLN